MTIGDSKTAYHVSIMCEAGLLDANVLTGAHGEPMQAIIFGLTWEGHDFLDAARDDTIWKAARDKIIKPGMSWTFSILLEWLKQEVRRRVLDISATDVEAMRGK